MPIVTRKHGVVTFIDDTPTTPLDVEVKPGEGNLSVDGLEEGGWVAVSVKDRGAHYEYVYTQEAEVSGSITVLLDDYLTDGTAEVPIDFAMKTGAFSGAVSFEATGEVYVCKVRAVWTAHSRTHTMEILQARVSAAIAEGETGNEITFSFTGYGTVTRTTA